MKGKLGDAARLQHILESINEIQSAVREKTEKEFFEDRVLRIAVVKWIEIIGEAANHLSEETKLSSEIEWKAIIGLRHIVVHEYFGISYHRIWDVVENDLPGLANKVEKMIKKTE